MSAPTTARRRVVVRDAAGLHARPCAALARAMRRFSSEAIVVAGGREASARSVLALLGLGIVASTEVDVVATGRDAAACADALAALLAAAPRDVDGR